MRVCSTCKKYKSTKQFTKRRDRPIGFASSCKKCLAKNMRKFRRKHPERAYYKIHPIRHKYAVLKYRYGLSIKDVEHLFSKQGKRCAICGRRNPGKRGWQIDHNHDTKKVRGILCLWCNVGISNLRESPQILLRAIQYLKRKQ